MSISIFGGDENDGWGQKGLATDELPEFVVFLKSLGALLPFEIGAIGFGSWTQFLYPIDEPWGHPSYGLRNLTREVIESHAHDSSHHHFLYVIVRKDFLDDGDGLPEQTATSH
jgi:hypothetical protein